MSDYVLLNGQITRYEDAASTGISPADAGLLHGAGLFETMRIRNKKIFRGQHHLNRLLQSAQILNIPIALDLPQLSEMVQDLCDVNSLSDARVRLTVTRGDLHAATREDPVPPVTLLLSASAFEGYPPALYQKGMMVVISKYKQNTQGPLTGHKVTSYFERLMGLKEAQEMKAGEALWFTTPDNYLAEGSISNIFLLQSDGSLATPPLTLPDKPSQRICLPGITRDLLKELASSLNIPLHEKLLTIHDLLAAREVFLTNAMMGIMPVTTIEKHTVNTGAPGPITTQLQHAYQQTLESETN